MGSKQVFSVTLVVACVGLYHASDWWERKFATFIRSETSPDGCIRVDTYKVIRLLPSQFYRIPHPDPEGENPRWMRWDAAIFERAYEVKNHDFLGETIVYDPTVSFDFIDWGDTRLRGRRRVVVNGFPLTDTDRCSDDATLERLEAYYAKEREADRPEKELLDEDRNGAGQRANLE